jgi:hypothetical protein
MTSTPHKVPGTQFTRFDDHPAAERNLYGEIKIFCGSGSQDLGHEVCDYLDLEPGHYERTQFSNENIFVRLTEVCAGRTCTWSRR